MGVKAGNLKFDIIIKRFVTIVCVLRFFSVPFLDFKLACLFLQL